MTATSPLLLTFPILDKMHAVEGWFEDAEADLLISAAAWALANSKRGEVVEIGSYQGRSTVVLASVLQAFRPQARVFAIDPHEGTVGSSDRGYETGPSTLERFTENISKAGLAPNVQLIQKKSYEVDWKKPIAVLFIDGLHDYENVSRDFNHFKDRLLPSGLVAFHDYSDYTPGVVSFVDELVASGQFRMFTQIRSLVVLRPEDRSSKNLPQQLFRAFRFR